MPVFCDWQVASLVCRKIDEVFAHTPGVSARILLVDDGSPQGTSGWEAFKLAGVRRIDVLELSRNMGHQRAIATGLCFIHDEMEADAVLVMDADGEDQPQDLPLLLARFRDSPRSVILAERRRRYENLVFRAGYAFYRALHRLLTGISVRAGNFSVLPWYALARLVTMSELWNHYAGAVYKSKLPRVGVQADRGARLAGKSHMNLVDLVVHGLSGITTFYDVVATRILVASVAALFLLTCALAIVVTVRLATSLAIPGWATYTAGLVFVLMMQFVTISFSLVFSLIATKWNMTVVPRRDYRIFVERIETLCTASSPPEL
jgi:polyisoprenyl-phosphate glycosyltransferase